ncbi:uracil-DNA glycosylase family protein [Paenibacillus harenae]|uniref:uracil-DNA glycosylase family protein n=1 Tax=Paenibacillus harenae TaxID=306543 RepID=UPI00040FF8BB|nr:uracil-DNA glycosylase family protein [Paenibacillus harenae]
MTSIGKYKSFIQSLPPGRLTKEQLHVKELLLESDGVLSVYYVPYEYVNEQAKVMIIGITPGFTQMEIAIRSARDDLRSGVPDSQIDENAKRLASFAGPMRANLIEMLDQIDLPGAIGIGSSALLFADEDEKALLHTTSVIRYPVFKNGRNYTGHSPAILRSAMLYKYAATILLPEVLAVKEALIIPLGKSVSEVMRAFVEQGFMDADRCLFDMPHPSGANGHRAKQFENGRIRMKEQVRSWFGR